MLVLQHRKCLCRISFTIIDKCTLISKQIIHKFFFIYLLLYIYTYIAQKLQAQAPAVR